MPADSINDRRLRSQLGTFTSGHVDDSTIGQRGYSVWISKASVEVNTALFGLGANTNP